MRPLAVSLAIVLSLAGTQILTAPSAFAHACPGGDKNVVVLDDPSDPRQIFDVNSSEVETVSRARTRPIEPYHAADRGT
jgi:hypothetical protein